MPYSKVTEGKIEKIIGRWNNIKKKKMFGGICYLINGNMCFGIYKEYLIVRTGIDMAEKKLKEKSVKPFDITTRVHLNRSNSMSGLKSFPALGIWPW